MFLKNEQVHVSMDSLNRKRRKAPMLTSYVYQKDAGRDSLALNWNLTVQNALCVEEEEVRRFPREYNPCPSVRVLDSSTGGLGGLCDSSL